MLTAIIVDDEKNARDVISYSIANFCATKVKVVGECANVDEAVKAINEHQPNIVFLDIEMPKQSGFQLLDYFDEINFEIVFITAYSNYAIKAFEVSAVDYLLKPLQIERFEQTITKIYNKSSKFNNDKIVALKENLAAKSLRKMCITYAGGIHIINIDNIIIIEAERAYSKIILYSRKSILASKSLNKFEVLLESSNDFFKTSRSYIINSKFINKYDSINSTIELEQNCIAKLARNKKSKFEEFLSKTTIKTRL